MCKKKKGDSMRAMFSLLLSGFVFILCFAIKSGAQQEAEPQLTTQLKQQIEQQQQHLNQLQLQQQIVEQQYRIDRLQQLIDQHQAELQKTQQAQQTQQTQPQQEAPQ